MATSKIEKKARWGTPQDITLPFVPPCDGVLKIEVASSGLGVYYVQGGSDTRYLCFTGSTQQGNTTISAPVFRGVTYSVSYSSNITVGSTKFIPLV